MVTCLWKFQTLRVLGSLIICIFGKQSTNPFQEVFSVYVKLISHFILDTEDHCPFLLKQFLMKILFEVCYMQHLIWFVLCWQSEEFLHIKSTPICDVKDEDILTYIQFLGGTSPELMQNEDIRNHLIHTFREDIRVLQTYS